MATATTAQPTQEQIDEGKWRLKMMKKREPLRADLVPFLEATGTVLGPTLRHPLLIHLGVDLDRAAWVNWCIGYKTERMEELRQEGDWLGVLGGYEYPFLVDGFCQEMQHMDDATYWESLGEVLTMQEQLWHQRQLLLRLLQSERPQREKLMTAEEQEAFAVLPDRITVHRGYIGRRGKGLSWTTDKDKAIWFARRFSELEYLGKPRLASGVVQKRDVLAYFTRHEESEVVVDPDRVKRQKRSLL